MTKPERIITIKKLTQDKCNPCRVVGFMLDAESELLEAMGVVVEEVNLSANPDMVEKYNVMSTPVLVFEKSGVEVGRISGMCNFDDVLGAIDAADRY